VLLTDAGSNWLVKLDGMGQPIWSKLLLVSHDVIVNQVEDTRWTGTFTSRGMTVGDDAIYIYGSYNNVYQTGSNPPPNFIGSVVLKFDLDGGLHWAKQYRLKPLPVETGWTGSPAAGTPSFAAKALGDGSISLTLGYTSKSGLLNSADTFSSLRIKADGSIN